jgi:glucose/arabinose dehydrogenase
MKRLVALLIAGLLAIAIQACNQAVGPTAVEPEETEELPRPVQAEDIQTAAGFQVEAAAVGFSYPNDIAFGASGEMYVSEVGGHTYGTEPGSAPPPRILRVNPDGSKDVLYDKVVPMDAIKSAQVTWEPEYSISDLPEGLMQPITGLTYNPDNDRLYVTHRSRVSTLDPETGEFNTIIDGMPSWGEFLNHKVIFGPDGKMYFALSSQGNSGPVDGHMIEVMKVFNKPNAREIPCEDVTVTGLDFMLDNVLTPEPGDMIRAETYAPLGVDTQSGDVIQGQSWCHGAMYRANPDGTGVERIAWGLRSLYGYDFSPSGRLVATQNSGNIMEPRPIYDDWEPIYEITEGAWYGWPDYYSGLPITDPRFTRPDDPEFEGKPFPHDFALTAETHQSLLQGAEAPPQPLVKLPVHAAAEGMVFGRAEAGIDPENEVLVADFGAIIPYYKDPPEWPGFRVQRVNLESGEISDFLINKSGKPAWAPEGGFGGLRRPLDLEWGPDGALYVVDFGVIHFSEAGMFAEEKTGVVWRVTASGQ